ncbi:coiled-coil domain-containing protein 17 isoform X2 [Falco naumanni]|uniref:coiled-coil domain-containing protein 17 isoform X2 n=1 Tax=Falco naumanni TaxID=148594 RepID=UPI001ADE6829|nr:coiled-coil domain-containing protein 17 isoform X2 [Falco naumanni]
MAGFRCPRCRMALGSRPLLRLHEERLCPGAPPAATSCPPGGAPLPAGGGPGHGGAAAGHPGTVGPGTGARAGRDGRRGAGARRGPRGRHRSQRGWVPPGLSRGHPAPPASRRAARVGVIAPSPSLLLPRGRGVPALRPPRLLVLPRLPPAGGGRGDGGPPGQVLTPRERALLRPAGAACWRPPGEVRPRARGGHRHRGGSPRPVVSSRCRPLQPPAQQEPRQGPAPGHGRQQPALREAHERRVSEIRARTRRLEQQREALCRRLAARAAATPRPEQGEVERSRALRDQAGRLRAAHGGAAPCLETAPPAGPLAAEARALRLAYLRAGGSDPAILDQLLQAQVEATLLEKGPAGLRGGRRTGEPQPPLGTLAPWPAAEAPPAVPAEPPGAGGRGLDAALLALELENRRLEDELLALKVRRERRADAGSWAAQQHAEELAQLQAEVGMLRCHAEWMGPQLPPAILPPPAAPPLLPALAPPELFAESPRPALTGSPAAPSHPRVPPSLPLAPFRALEDPPPAREPPAQHKPR